MKITISGLLQNYPVFLKRGSLEIRERTVLAISADEPETGKNIKK